MRVENGPGGYAYLPSSLGFACAGVSALPGFTIDRVTLSAPQRLPGGFQAVSHYLDSVQRPVSALCGLELRSPKTLPARDFADFNRTYIAQLEAWGLLRDGVVPLTRTNVAPVANAPAGPALLAFSYTVPRTDAPTAFVIAGTGEVPDGSGFPDGIVRPGETSQDALTDKLHCVIDTVDTRVRSLGAVWDNSCSVHLYSAHEIAYLFRRALRDRIGVVPDNGIAVHDTVPPVDGLELEIDVRRYHRELTLPPS